ncbi:restriction endonuclease subunit S [Halomonas sp. GXIMD04776]|uniref:restriction endonuclease subunit S n=1 Tax=Halomonas sp. GXIMD04776 TaxID=3415605 RepID=UPI003C7EF02F
MDDVVNEVSAQYLTITNNTEAQELPMGWASCKLKEIIQLNYGKALKKTDRNDYGKTPVYGSSGIVGYHDAPLTTEPSLIIGRKGAVGSIYLETKNCWPIDTVYFSQVPSGTNAKYLKYLLSFANLNRLEKSTAIPGLSRSDANEVIINLNP